LKILEIIINDQDFESLSRHGNAIIIHHICYAFVLTTDFGESVCEKITPNKIPQIFTKITRTSLFSRDLHFVINFFTDDL
jgi:hypothetical protein